MTKYLGISDYEHGTPSRLGVLVTNLGTPNSPNAADVRRYLAEFLWDPRIIEAPRWLWWLVLHGVILRIRPARSAHAYRQIWTEQGSPLLLHSRALSERIGVRLQERLGTSVQVALGMTYGAPSIASALRELHAANCRRIVVLPLYPQYSATTVGSVFDRVADQLKQWRWLPELRLITSYHDLPAYIDAIANSIREHWRTQPRNHLLFSFHGVPRRYLLAGDPYHCECMATARLVAEALHLSRDEWSVSFQSQVGREEWLRPYTDELLNEYAQQGRRDVTVVCPGFAADCLETLEEIALRHREAFLAAGGQSLSYVPALNASDTHAEFLSELILRHAQGWPETSGVERTDPSAVSARALLAGAPR